MARDPLYADPQRYIELVGFEGGWRDLFWNRDFLAFMADRLGFDEVADMLDVGCGAGHWGRALLPHLPDDARLVGVDREQAFFDLAREHTDTDRSRFVVGEAEALPFEDESFDLVTCQTLLIHVRDPAVAIAEMKRVLRPGGLLLAAEPDNRAGNLALLNGEPRPSDDDVLAILQMLLRGEAGKLALGEGDQSVGGRLPGLFAAAGLRGVVAHTNDRCISIYPPYDRPDVKVALDQELAWMEEDVSILSGSREDNLRFCEAGGGSEEEFERGWAAVRRWMRSVKDGVDAGTYHGARGFVMYLVAGWKLPAE
jgi:SAM-dependent methyltransferase